MSKIKNKILKLVLGTLLTFFLTAFAVLPVQAETHTFVSNLQPSWNAVGGGGVWSSYSGYPGYEMVSPGITTLYEGREAGIIKAGLTPEPDGHYWDDGIFAFKPDVTINALASKTFTYDVVNQYGENPVWITIEIDTGEENNRDDNTTYQFVPTTNPTSWHTVDAATGLWQKWDNDWGTVSEAPISLDSVAITHTGLSVVRTYLRLGMGDSYHGALGQGTVAWVDKATLGGVTYDFVVKPAKVNICHLDKDTGTYKLLSISTNAEPAHRKHGDEIPGDNFTENCVKKVVTGQWLLSVNGGMYKHDMFIETQNPDGSLIGTGGYPSDGSYLPGFEWTMDGQLTGNLITITTHYDNGYTATITGTVNTSWDSMSGGNGTGGVTDWIATRVQ